jgi:hypothetical protein
MINVAFCFIVKDGSKYLEKNLQNIIDLSILFCDEYKIFYVENDSIDNTKEILEKFKLKNNNIFGKHLNFSDSKYSTELCSNNFDFNCSKRLNRLAYLRNIALNQAKEWSLCNYMIMLDLDFIDFDKKEFINMFNLINKNKNIDGIFGMSITTRGNLYDIGAVKPLTKILAIILENKLIKVNSAFSGFGIYRMKLIIDKNLNYNVNSNDLVDHISFNENFNNLYVYTPFRPIYTPSTAFLSYFDLPYFGLNFISNYIIFYLFLLLILLILFILYLSFKLFIKKKIYLNKIKLK